MGVSWYSDSSDSELALDWVEAVKDRARLHGVL